MPLRAHPWHHDKREAVVRTMVDCLARSKVQTPHGEVCDVVCYELLFQLVKIHSPSHNYFLLDGYC